MSGEVTDSCDGIKLTFTRTVVLPKGTMSIGSVVTAINAAIAAGKLDDTLRTKYNFYNNAAALYHEDLGTATEVTVTTSFADKI